jgi:hypothetical protein
MLPIPSNSRQATYLPKKLMGGQTLEREGPASSAKGTAQARRPTILHKGYTLPGPAFRFPDPSCPREANVDFPGGVPPSRSTAQHQRDHDPSDCFGRKSLLPNRPQSDECASWRLNQQHSKGTDRHHVQQAHTPKTYPCSYPSPRRAPTRRCSAPCEAILRHTHGTKPSNSGLTRQWPVARR